MNKLTFAALIALILLAPPILIGEDFGRIFGQILDQNKQPVSGVRIELVPDDNPSRNQFIWTDSNGYYEFKLLNRGNYYIMVDRFWNDAWPSCHYVRMLYPHCIKINLAYKEFPKHLLGADIDIACQTPSMIDVNSTSIRTVFSIDQLQNTPLGRASGRK